ncbi:MAG TPA: 2Fe-2S iron-sulfur cluster binding domain-containing protein [Thermoflexia bacterium]|nr:2Fe-2S iron-sulfur cluster binding domain-containing protein [Thermoflexia bacterium]
MTYWDVYYTVTSVDEAARLLAEHAGQARIIAGGTDLVVELRKGARQLAAVIDISRVGGWDYIERRMDGLIHVGPAVSHTQAAASPLLQEHALPLAQACWGVGAPALRNRGTIAGNLATASPANDTITALRALEAQVTLRSVRGARTLPLAEFYQGVRRTAMQPDELLVDIAFAPLAEDEVGVYLKLGLRKVLAIAVTNVAVVLRRPQGQIAEARIALGSVAPTIIRAPAAEEALCEQRLTPESIEAAAQLAAEAATPIDDVRGSAWFRNEEVAALVRRGLQAVQRGEERLGLPQPAEMVKLWGKSELAGGQCWPTLSGPTIVHHAGGDEPIQCTVNGKNVSVQGANDKTLLHLLREELGLTGTKVGCEEGECGACTVWLDGVAVLACLTPAPRAHGASIVTVEGLAQGEQLHPVQAAFIAEDAVQCGYCTPGFVMSAANLLAEMPHPTREQISAALSGNLCRCTGYYKIIQAVERAAGDVMG